MEKSKNMLSLINDDEFIDTFIVKLCQNDTLLQMLRTALLPESTTSSVTLPSNTILPNCSTSVIEQHVVPAVSPKPSATPSSETDVSYQRLRTKLLPEPIHSGTKMIPVVDNTEEEGTTAILESVVVSPSSHAIMDQTTNQRDTSVAEKPNTATTENAMNEGIESLENGRNGISSPTTPVEVFTGTTTT